MSMYFYEINRAGRLPADTRVPWRGDTLKLKPGSPASRDGPHEGGYFDAGDHNKFMLPEAYAIGRLAWMGWMEKPTLRSTYFDVRSLECICVLAACVQALFFIALFVCTATTRRQQLMVRANVFQIAWPSSAMLAQHCAQKGDAAAERRCINSSGPCAGRAQCEVVKGGRKVGSRLPR